MDYVTAGFDPDAFWRLTPRLYLVHMRGAAGRRQREQEDREWLAWHTAMIGRMQKPPRFQSFSSAKKKEPASRTPSWQQQLAMWRTYAAYRKRG